MTRRLKDVIQERIPVEMNKRLLRTAGTDNEGKALVTAVAQDGFGKHNRRLPT